MPDPAPTPAYNPLYRTTSAVGIAGAGTVVLAWLLGQAHVEVPSDVQDALVILIGWGAGVLVHREPNLFSKHTAPVVTAPTIPVPPTP